MTTRRWFCYNVTGQQAEKLLVDKGQYGSYLGRPSQTRSGSYSLSVRCHNDEVIHIKILNSGDQYYLSTGPKFNALEELVGFYINDNTGSLRDTTGKIIELKRPLNLQNELLTERWYHGSLNGQQAEALLHKRGQDGSYLIRLSVHNPGSFVLSVKVGHEVSHILIENKDNRYSVRETETTFSSLTELLKYYERKVMLIEASDRAVNLKVPLLNECTSFLPANISHKVAELTQIDTSGKTGFYEEFLQLQQQKRRGLYHVAMVSMQPENRTKNRHNNILPFNHTRVVLKSESSVSDEPESDYINANYINLGPGLKQAYIASQGCLPNTVIDFWKMIWQENILIIVMISNEVGRAGRNECAQYWPNFKEKKLYGNLHVENINEFPDSHYIQRFFNIQHHTSQDMNTRCIYQFHFQHWPEDGVPNDSAILLSFHKLVTTKLDSFASWKYPSRSLVVHGSAGVGRTGVFIAIDALINLIRHNGLYHEMDINNLVKHMRTQRSGMVQNKKQYKFIYEAIQAYVKSFNAMEDSIMLETSYPLYAVVPMDQSIDDTPPSHQSHSGVPISSNTDTAYNSYCQSVDLNTVKERAQIPFINHISLTCSHEGLKHEEHGFSLMIPEGIIAVGEELPIELGVTMYGPFNIPDNTRLVSPVLWLYATGEPKQSFQVTLPHIIRGLTQKKAEHYDVGFCKACYRDNDTSQMIFDVQRIASSNDTLSCSVTASHGTITINQFCILFMIARNKPGLKSDIEYRLIYATRTLQLKQECFFCVAYNLDINIRAIEDHFPKNEGYMVHVDPLKCFKFMEFEFPACVKFSVKENKDFVIISANDHQIQEIKASDVDFMARNFKEIHGINWLALTCIKIIGKMKENIDEVCLKVEVNGSNNDQLLSTELLFPSRDPEEEKHILAVRKAINEKGHLDHIIIHGVFVGLARSGKDSLMKRLLGKRLSSHDQSCSTGVAENPIQVKVHKNSDLAAKCVLAANIEGSIWSIMDYDDEAIKLMLITSNHNESTNQNQFGESQVSSKKLKFEGSKAVLTESGRANHASKNIHSTNKIQQRNNCRPKTKCKTNIVAPTSTAPTQTVSSSLDPIGRFKKALKNKDLKTMKQHFQNTWSLYLTNTGGQMEFQEVLPLVVSGPAMFFFTFRLDRDLKKHYSIQYDISTEMKSYPYTAISTTIEGILQTLASISAMGTFVYHGLQKKQAPLRPKVFFVGTHKDMLDPSSVTSRIANVDKELQEVINLTTHYKDLVEYASESQLIFTVNNFSESDSDFQSLRSAVERVVLRDRPHISLTSPAHWLILSLALRNLDSHVITYDHCFEIAKQCGITEQKELNQALHFIHTKMGVIRYFPYEGVKNIVIINPQFLFNKVTELIVDTFTFEKVGKSKMEEFKQKGIFSMDEFEQINAKNQSEITSSQFGKLLVHLRIAAPFQINGEDKLFLPCVLAHAKTSPENSLLLTPMSPLLVVFDCGYIPKGVPGALITYLMTNEMKSSFEWVLSIKKIFRDQISFGVGPYDTIVIKTFPTHFEISCIPDEQFMDDRTSPIEEICDEVLKAINVGIPQVLKDLNYIKGQHMLTFQCTAPNCEHKHKTRVCMDKSGCSGTLLCQITEQRLKLPSDSYYWGYGKKPRHQESETGNASRPSTRSQHTQFASTQPYQTSSSIQLTPTPQDCITVLQECSIQQAAASSGNQTLLKEEHHSVVFEQLCMHSCNWIEIGRHLGFLQSELRNIQARPLLLSTAPNSWLSTVLQEWLQWAPGDSRGSKSFATLENLKLALLNAGFGATAHNLHI